MRGAKVARTAASPNSCEARWQGELDKIREFYPRRGIPAATVEVLWRKAYGET